ncbi:MAG: phytanoyl-CoA dioxygenase family protein, partial [Gammaproteobacteria bacterium]|nr:phytanoyl-CoA dioxygenase family protein [Gammaproteobacteria bacterium]
MAGLSSSDLNKYWENGFISPIDVFTSSETRRLRQEFESLEHHFGGQDRARSFTTDIHLIQRWAWDVATNPRILACVSGALGDNVLLWSTNWFIKEPGDRKIVSFHQDASYWGLEP